MPLIRSRVPDKTPYTPNNSGSAASLGLCQPLPRPNGKSRPAPGRPRRRQCRLLDRYSPSPTHRLPRDRWSWYRQESPPPAVQRRSVPGPWPAGRARRKARAAPRRPAPGRSVRGRAACRARAQDLPTGRQPIRHMYEGEEPPPRRGGRVSGGGLRRALLPRPRRSLGARRSALGARRSALGARRSALGARHCTASRNVPQCQPCSLSPPTTIHFALRLTGIGLPPCCGVHGRPAAIPTDKPTPLKPFRQWRGCGTAARPLSFDTCIRP